MKFLLMIHIEEAVENAYTKADWERLDRGYEAFAAEVVRRGGTFEGGALTAPSTAKTVRVRNGKTLVADGPFAETKEWIGGYFVVDCASMEEAIELAAFTPGAASNGVEVRAHG